MSKAFTKEDVDPPERSGRVRSASGLPPGAANYITKSGAARLQAELTQLRATGNDAARMAELEGMLASVTIVDQSAAASDSVAFGSIVTLEDGDGKREIYRVVGVDELNLEPDSVSWISPIGKTLLAAELGDRVTLEGGRTAKVVKID
jgi:transcription elongation GreA/GreB family factor